MSVPHVHIHTDTYLTGTTHIHAQILTSLALLKDTSEVEAIAVNEERMEVGVVTAEVTTPSVMETTPTVAKRDELPSNWGTTVAAGISTGVEVVSRTVEKGAVLANKAIVMVGMYI